MNELLRVPPKIDGQPRWLTEQSSDLSPEVIKDYYHSFYFWRRWEGKEDILDDPTILQRANAVALLSALQQTAYVMEVAEESVIFQLSEADRTQWYRHVEEIEDVKELIQTKLERTMKKHPGSGYITELRRMLRVIDTLDAMGIPKKDIIKFPLALTKAKLVAPMIEQIAIENGPDKVEAITKLLDMVSDKNVHTDDLEVKLAAIKNPKPKFDPANATVYVVSDGEMIVISSHARYLTVAIEEQLKGLAKGFGIEDSVQLLRDLSEKMMPKKNDMAMYSPKRTDNGIVISRDGNGIPLPSPEGMKEILNNAIAKYRYFISQSKDHLYLPLYIITKYMPIAAWLETIGMEEKDLETITAAFNTFYDESSENMLELECTIEFRQDPFEQSIGLYARI